MRSNPWIVAIIALGLAVIAGGSFLIGSRPHSTSVAANRTPAYGSHIDTLLGIAPGASSRAAEVRAYYTQFLADDGQVIANGWLAYATAHTNLDAAITVQAYADSLAAEGISKSHRLIG